MKKALLIVFSLVVGVALFVFMLQSVDINTVVSLIQDLSLLWLFLCIAAYSATFILRAWRWKIILISVKNSVRTNNTFWITAVGFLVNLTIPLRFGGEIARAFIIDKKEKTGFFQGLSSIVVERLLDLLGIVTLGVVALFLVPVSLDQLSWFIDALKIIGVLVLLAFVGIFVGAKKAEATLRLVDRILSHVPLLPQKWKEKIKNLVKSLIEGASGVYYSPSAGLATLLLTLVLWAMQFLNVYFLFQAFNFDVAVAIALLGSMLISLSFILPAAPGFIGTYETYWTVIFVGLGITNMDLIVASGLVNHLIIMIVTLTLGSAGIMWLGLSFEELLNIRKPNQPK